MYISHILCQQFTRSVIINSGFESLFFGRDIKDAKLNIGRSSLFRNQHKNLNKQLTDKSPRENTLRKCTSLKIIKHNQCCNIEILTSALTPHLLLSTIRSDEIVNQICLVLPLA